MYKVLSTKYEKEKIKCPFNDLNHVRRYSKKIIKDFDNLVGSRFMLNKEMKTLKKIFNFTNSKYTITYKTELMLLSLF